MTTVKTFQLGSDQSVKLLEFTGENRRNIFVSFYDFEKLMILSSDDCAIHTLVSDSTAVLVLSGGASLSIDAILTVDD